MYNHDHNRNIISRLSNENGNEQRMTLAVWSKIRFLSLIVVFTIHCDIVFLNIRGYFIKDRKQANIIKQSCCAWVCLKIKPFFFLFNHLEILFKYTIFMCIILSKFVLWLRKNSILTKKQTIQEEKRRRKGRKQTNWRQSCSSFNARVII